MEKINIAILGFGFMGKVYAFAAETVHHFFPNVPIVTVKHVLVSSRANLEEIKKRYRFPNVTRDFQDILNDCDTQAIYIALPNDMHAYYACKAISAGKHILCDKPLEINYAKASKMVSLSKKNPSIVSRTVFEYRFIPAIKEIRNLLNQGRLGKILQFRVLYLHGSYAEKRPVTWRLKKNIGGVLRDLGPHVIDLTNFLLGPLKSYRGEVSKKYSEREVEDIVRILCETENGADGYLEVSRLAVGSVDDLRIEIHGESGAVRWSLENLNFFEFFSKENSIVGYQKVPAFVDKKDAADFPPEKVSADWLRPHIGCLYSFIKDIEHSERADSISASFDDGLYVQRVIDDILNGSKFNE